MSTHPDGSDTSSGAANAEPTRCFEVIKLPSERLALHWSAQLATPPGCVTLVWEAPEGGLAMRLCAPAGGVAGLDSDQVSVTDGTAKFSHRLLSSSVGGLNLVAHVIAVDAAGHEVGRVSSAAPNTCEDDREWHEVGIDFDFRQTAACGVFLAARINEGADVGDGEWLLADSIYVERKAVASGEIETFRLLPAVVEAGQSVDLVVQVANTGNVELPPSRLRLSLPSQVSFWSRSSTDVDVPALSPIRSYRHVVRLKGRWEGEFDLVAEWAVAGERCARSLHGVCVEHLDPRALCTRDDGFWRFMPRPVSLQAGNPAPLTPLPTLKSSELPDSFCGVTAHLPRSRDLERVFEPEHLIDGDPHTSWASRPHASAAPGDTEWVEVTFAQAERIGEIRLVPYHRAEGFPVDFTVQLLQDGAAEPVFEGVSVHLPAPTGEGTGTPYLIRLTEPLLADGVRIEVTRFSPAAPFFCEPCLASHFRLSEVEALDDQGRNVALAAAGAQVEVSSTFRSFYNSPEVVCRTYPQLYELGMKWNRVGQWGDWTTWSAVEQRKGEYRIDPDLDAAVDDSLRNGVNILYTLGYGNPLYEETPWHADLGPVWRHGHPFAGHGGPTAPAAIEGFVNYAKFVAQHFRGRITHYEVWNEENSWGWYGSPPDPKAFGALLRETAKALKEVDPTITVIAGGTAALAPTFIADALKEGAGPYIDAVAFHPYTMPYPELGLGTLDVVGGEQVSRKPSELGFTTYREMIAFLKDAFAPFNPNFSFWANEWNAIPTREDMPYQGMSELSEAKQAARFYLMNTLLGIHAVWWSLTNQNMTHDWAILRADDLSRKPSFYTMQAMTTLLSGAHADDSIRATAMGDAPELYCEPLRGRDGEIMVAVWSAIAPADDYAGTRVALRIEDCDATTADAVDTLHALVQTLDLQRDGSAVVITGLLVTDYPVVVRCG